MMSVRRFMVLMLLTVITGAITWNLLGEFDRGQEVDRCVSELVRVVDSKQEAELSQLVKARSLAGKLLQADRVEFVYARPKTSQWARVGLVVQQPGVSSTGAIMGLLLDLERLPQCQFIRDYESGAFGSHGRENYVLSSTSS